MHETKLTVLVWLLQTIAHQQSHIEELREELIRAYIREVCRRDADSNRD